MPYIGIAFFDLTSRKNSMLLNALFRLPAWDRYRPSSEFDPGDDNVSVTSFHSQRSGRSGASRRKKKNVYEELYKSMTINYE